jgi:dethiobiotin synthetase
MLDVFIVGTDAGAGTGRAASLYAARATARGRTPGYLRPVETGGGDAARTIAAAVPGTVCATVYRFVAPLAPGLAARLQHAAPIAIDAIVEAVEELRAATDGVIVDTGEGLLAPLGDGTTVADLALALGLPLLVVTRPMPACLNHAALTLDAARRRGIEIAGLVVTDCVHRPDLAERSTRAALADLAPVLDSLPVEPVAVSARRS